MCRPTLARRGIVRIVFAWGVLQIAFQVSTAKFLLPTVVPPSVLLPSFLPPGTRASQPGPVPRRAETSGYPLLARLRPSRIPRRSRPERLLPLPHNSASVLDSSGRKSGNREVAIWNISKAEGGQLGDSACRGSHPFRDFGGFRPRMRGAIIMGRHPKPSQIRKAQR